MAIALGQHAVAATAAFSPVTSLTTPTGHTTAATGSTFAIIVEATAAIASSTPVADSFGNTYTQKATATVIFASIFTYVYVCDNGTGGANHTATANFSASAAASVYLIEVTGAANPSVDVSNTFLNNSGVTSQAGASVTTTNANDLILSMIVLGNNDTISDAAAWNAILDKSNPSNSSSIPTSAVSFQIETSTGTYHDTYTFGGNEFTGGLTIAFKAASGGSNITLSLTGQGATMTPGALGAATAIPLVGQGATSAAGTITPSRALGIVGQAAAFSAGAILPAVALSLLGQAAIFSTGTITASIGGNLTLSLTGQAASSTAGNLTPARSAALAGQSAAFIAGTLVPGVSASLLGVSAAFSTGALSPTMALALLGTQAVFGTGTVTVGANGNLTLNLTGQAAAFATGSLAPALSAPIAGISAAFALGSILPSAAVGIVGQAATFATGSIANGGVSISLNGSRATLTTGFVSLPIVGAGPRYIVSRAIGRKFIAAHQTGRNFEVARAVGRAFKVSAIMSQRFDVKDPSESLKLTFDFTPDLALLPAVLLSGTPGVTILNVFGGDNSLVVNGAAALDSTNKMVIVPISGGLAENDYQVRVVITTTDAKTILELTGTLPVRS